MYSDHYRIRTLGFWSDPDRQVGCDSASTPLSCQTLEELELQGTDISAYEPVVSRFFRLKAPTTAWTSTPILELCETIFMEPLTANNTGGNPPSALASETKHTEGATITNISLGT